MELGLEHRRHAARRFSTKSRNRLAVVGQGSSTGGHLAWARGLTLFALYGRGMRPVMITGSSGSSSKPTKPRSVTAPGGLAQLRGDLVPAGAGDLPGASRRGRWVQVRCPLSSVRARKRAGTARPEPEGVLDVDPAAHRPGRLPVGKVPHTLTAASQAGDSRAAVPVVPRRRSPRRATDRPAP